MQGGTEEERCYLTSTTTSTTMQYSGGTGHDGLTQRGNGGGTSRFSTIGKYFGQPDKFMLRN